MQRIRSKDTFGYVVKIDGKPIGYIQYYYVDRTNEKTCLGPVFTKVSPGRRAGLPDLPETTVGTDQFIGDPDYLHKGYGTRFIKEFLILLGQHSEAPRHMYFHGPHGIGKTFFVHKLSEWLEELLPDSVRFEDMIISCADELEGNGQRPGALLRALRDQLKAGKRGFVIFMDEANWINSPGMESASKRTFNGEQSKLRTTYFGDGLDGSGIVLDSPPMLIFVASNEEIKNPALKSRFDVIEYPLPKQDALAKHAHGVAKRSVLINDADIPDKTKVEGWITGNKVDNFRQVEANVEQFVLS